MSNSKLAAVLIALAMVIWVFSGELASNIVIADDQAKKPTRSETMPLVRAMESTAKPQSIFLEVSGQTRANRTVDVKAEVSGRVEVVAAEKGTAVKTGDVLCKIAVDTRKSDFDQALAELKSAQLEYNGVQDLKRQGLQSEINVAKAKAALEMSRAMAKRAELALAKTEIIAPFAGVVENQPVEVGDFLNVGQICVSLIEIDPILVVGEVAERNISAVSLGDEVEVRLISGDMMKGAISFIARAPDPNTRTYPIEVTVNDPEEGIRTGMSAEMRVPVGAGLGHLISPASLVLNDQGEMGVRVIDDASKVRFKKVSILHESPEGIWVTGLPETTKIITIGQEDVFEGQMVKFDLSPLGISSASESSFASS